MCVLLAEPANPLTHSLAEAPPCLMQRLHEFVTTGGGNDSYTWPVTEASFVPALHALLLDDPDLGEQVGG